MADQFDVPLARRKVLEENAKRRAVLRNEFLKQVSDPFRHASGEGGAVFDPALQRYQAMSVTHYDHFKAGPKTARFGILGLLVPFVGFSYLLKTSREKLERQYRNGEVAYKDREFKFI